MEDAAKEDPVVMRWGHLVTLRRIVARRSRDKGRAWKTLWGRPDWVIVDAAIEAGIDPRVALNAMGLYVSTVDDRLAHS